jgi:hypothetical protein
MNELMSPTVAKVATALIKATANFDPAIRDSENLHFKSKFVSLAAVNRAVDPALLTEGLLVVQQTDVIDGQNTIVSRLLHESGEWLAGYYRLTPAKQNDPQAEGSAMTYGRRYAKMALLGIAPEDDDGNAASRPPTQAAATPEDPSPYHAAIAAAATMDELSSAGAMVAAATLAERDRVELREAYTEQMAYLKGTPEGP